jgi:ethanolamine utilization protein EutN
MRIARIIGTVTLNRCHPTFVGARLRLAQPLNLPDLAGPTAAGAEAAEELVVWDVLGAGLGSLIALSEGPEAAQPFRPLVKPLDAYNAAILDHVEIEPL